MGQLSACKTQSHHLEQGLSFSSTIAVEKPATSSRHAAFLRVSIITVFTIFTVQECWVEKAHDYTLPPLLSFQTLVWKQFWNHFLHIMCYPVVSLGPGTGDRTLTVDLFWPYSCWLFCRTTSHCNIKRHLFQQPVWLMRSQVKHLLSKCLCALCPAHSQFSTWSCS